MVTYKLFCRHDIGDRSVFIESSSNPEKAISYIQQKTIELFNDESLSLSNLSIANALVAFFDCSNGARKKGAIPIDIFPLERKWELSELVKENPSLIKPNEEIILHMSHHVGDQ